MEIGPIVSALRRNKVGAVLICLQIALTLAIVCNALFVIQQRAQRMTRPSGLDEGNVFSFQNTWVGAIPDAKARVQEDLAALRAMPGVVDAAVSNSFPLRGGGWSTSVGRDRISKQDQNLPRTALYFVDEHIDKAWGLKLAEGRWFTADEIGTMQEGEIIETRIVIVSRALARQLFPDGSALGKTIWFEAKPATIVGIVETMQTPWAATGWGEPFVDNAVLAPFLYLYNGARYIVRTQPGRRDSVMNAASARLLEINHARVIDRLEPFTESRARRYRGDHALNVILGTVCGLLLAVTACGIVGLTSYWIAQRRRQIGVRRALGARRIDILRYFHTENLLIAGIGGVLGVALALAGNLWLVKTFEMTRMGMPFVLLGGAIVLVLGQAAVLWPALRAASIPPALATRAA